MLQKKILFSQSSVSLEIIGLPDHSNDEKRDQISIISQWKLMIIDKPLIEGDVNHLSSIIDAFLTYSNFIINEDNSFYESKLIDIKTENFYTHSILLKSSKENVKPLNIKIGNSVLSDILNCFDQFKASDKVRNISSNVIFKIPRKNNFKLKNKDKISTMLLPPFMSICSIFIISSAFVFYNNYSNNEDENSLINYNNKHVSVKSINTIV